MSKLLISMLWYCQLQQGIIGNSGYMKPWGSYLAVAFLMVPFPTGTWPGNKLCFQTRKRVLHHTTYTCRLHNPVTVRIWFWYCFQFMWGLSPLFTDEQGDSILPFPVSSPPSTLTISEEITHDLAFFHLVANKLVTYNFPAGALWTNTFQFVDNVLL